MASIYKRYINLRNTRILVLLKLQSHIISSPASAFWLFLCIFQAAAVTLIIFSSYNPSKFQFEVRTFCIFLGSLLWGIHALAMDWIVPRDFSKDIRSLGCNWCIWGYIKNKLYLHYYSVLFVLRKQGEIRSELVEWVETNFSFFLWSCMLIISLLFNFLAWGLAMLFSTTDITTISCKGLKVYLFLSPLLSL